MKKILLLIMLVVASISLTNAQAKRQCAAHTIHEEKMAKDEKYRNHQKDVENYTRNYIKSSASTRARTGGTLTIPVYVHVIYSNSQENISDAQIASQISVLNEDFSATNSDISGTPSEFAGFIADYEIQFELVGTTRKSSSTTSWGTNDAMKQSSQGGVDPITPQTHLNMWVCEIGGSILGYAQFPGDDWATDGVVMGPNYFGSSDYGNNFYLSSPFDKGRTATHEVGHYLNLRHIWGDGNCNADDFVTDTPPAGGSNNGCPSAGTKSCNANTYSQDMFMNYMDYTDDACMFMFTNGQLARTNSVLDPGGSREDLGYYGAACALSAPSGFASSSIGDNSFNLSWNADSGADSYTVTVGNTSSTISGTSFSASALSAGTTYACTVVANCSTGGSSATSAINVTTTGSAPITYCASNGNSVSDEYIGRVQLGSIDNTSSANASGYTDHTALSTNLEIGVSNTITITPTWTGTVYSEGYAVWIDYNQDGDFSDSGEQVVSVAASQTTPVSGSFTVPASASAGNTRMRVSMKYNGVPTTCEAFSYGEVEDYTVNISSASADTSAPTVPSSLASGSIAETSFNVSWTASTDNVAVTSYSIYVNGSLNGTSTNTNYTVSGLSVATSYTVRVSAADAAGNVSSQSSVLNVTTVDQTAPTAPSGVSASNTTQTTTDISWTASTDNVGVNAYNVSVNGVSQGTTSATSISLTGLSASTTYTVTVSATDAAGNNSTSGSTSVTTLDATGGGCTGGISSFPYNEGFESGIGSWSQDSGDDLDWTVDASGTPSGSTGPSSATEGTNYIFIEASGNGTGYPNKVASLTSSCFDLSAESSASFSFSYHMYGSAMGTLDLQASTNGTSWTSIWSLSGDQSNAWSSANVDLASYTGGTVTLRFVGTTSSSYTSDMAIDNMSLTNGAAASCSDVTLTLVLDDYPAETSWSVTNGTGTTVMSGGSYNATSDKNVTKIDTSCLPDGCYTFTINDTYGDGICCSYGNGSFALEDTNGTLLASGGSFTNSSSTNFCLSGASSRSALVERFVPTSHSMVYPNPATNMLFVNAPADLISIEVYSISGLKMNSVIANTESIDISSLNAGLYIVNIKTEKATISRRFFKN